MLRHAPGLLGSLAGSVRLEFLRVGGRIGLDDPAETGRLFGLIYPLRFLPLGRRVRLGVEPAFDGAAFSGEAALAVRVVPVRVLLPVLVFGWRVLAGRG